MSVIPDKGNLTIAQQEEANRAQAAAKIEQDITNLSQQLLSGSKQIDNIRIYTTDGNMSVGTTIPTILTTSIMGSMDYFSYNKDTKLYYTIPSNSPVIYKEPSTSYVSYIPTIMDINDPKFKTTTCVIM